MSQSGSLFTMANHFFGDTDSIHYTQLPISPKIIDEAHTFLTYSNLKNIRTHWDDYTSKSVNLYLEAFGDSSFTEYVDDVCVAIQT